MYLAPMNEITSYLLRDAEEHYIRTNIYCKAELVAVLNIDDVFPTLLKVQCSINEMKLRKAIIPCFSIFFFFFFFK